MWPKRARMNAMIKSRHASKTFLLNLSAQWERSRPLRFVAETGWESPRPLSVAPKWNGKCHIFRTMRLSKMSLGCVLDSVNLIWFRENLLTSALKSNQRGTSAVPRPHREVGVATPTPFWGRGAVGAATPISMWL